MKKTIILNIICILSLILLIVALVFIVQLNSGWYEVEKYINYTSGDVLDKAKEFESQMFRLFIPIILIGVGALVDIVLIVLIDLPLIKRLNKSKSEELKKDE